MSSPLRLIFMGTPDFAVPSLNALAAGPHGIVEVVTQPDRPRGRGRKLAPSDVKVAAEELELPVFQPESLRDPGVHEHLRALAPDLIVVVAYSILPPEVLAIPRLGSINLHASLLPKYRGAAPIQWAVINGDEETGVSVFFLDPSVDTGRIVRQKATPIGPDETYGDVYDRLKVLGAAEIEAAVADIAAGTVTPVPQDDAAATKAPKLHREDARIDWNSTAHTIRNLVRGTNPVPGAWTVWNDDPYRILRVDVVDEDDAKSCAKGLPGAVVLADSKVGIAVATSDAPVWLTTLRPPGKREMSGAAWLNGVHLQVGEQFE